MSTFSVRASNSSVVSKVKRVYNQEDIDSLQIGNFVQLAHYGRARYCGNIDGYEIFITRDKFDKNDRIIELFFDRRDLEPSKEGIICSKAGPKRGLKNRNSNLPENRREYEHLDALLRI